MTKGSFMFKQAMKWMLLPAAAAVLVACGGGGGGGGGVAGGGAEEGKGLQNPSAFKLPESLSAVPPQE